MVSLYIPSILLLLVAFAAASLGLPLGVLLEPEAVEPVDRQAGIKYFNASNSLLILIRLRFSIMECNCFVSDLRFANSSSSMLAVDLLLLRFCSSTTGGVDGVDPCSPLLVPLLVLLSL